MAKALRRETLRSEGYNIHVIGAPGFSGGDLYHVLLRVHWWVAFAIIVITYLSLNVVFACLYVAVGGVANANAHSLLDAFFFSVQTMGTIGYGSMYPVGTGAQFLVVAESVVGLLVTALATGLVFARFSQMRARLRFSSRIAVGPMDGERMLMLRVGNERRGNIVDARFRLTLTRTTKTAEGSTFYRLEELPLMRARAPALSRSWTVMHRLDQGSPLNGYDAEKLAAIEGELRLDVSGIDDTSLQPVHAQHTWFAGSVAWNARLADVLSETPEGDMVLDLRNFHEIVPIASS
jgi:inward rectifier potassium channel